IFGSPGKCRVARGWWNYPGQPRGLVALQENCTAFLFHRIRPLSATHFDLATSGDGTEASNILGRDGADRRGCGGPKRQVVLSGSRAVDLEGDKGDVVLRALLPGPTLDPPQHLPHCPAQRVCRRGVQLGEQPPFAELLSRRVHRLKKSVG